MGKHVVHVLFVIRDHGPSRRERLVGEVPRAQWVKQAAGILATDGVG